MEDLYQEIVNALIGTVPVVMGLLGVWAIGKVTGLWELIKDERKRRIVRRSVAYIVSTEIDEITQAKLIEATPRIVNGAEFALKRSGINVELDELNGLVVEAIDKAFDYIRAKAGENASQNS